MHRNMKKQEETGRQIIRKHCRYDLNTAEMAQILSSVKGLDYHSAIFSIINTAFYAGIAAGKRIGDRERGQ